MIDITKLTVEELQQVVEWFEDDRAKIFLAGLKVAQERELDKLITGSKAEDRRAEDETRGQIKACGKIFSIHDNCILQMREMEKQAASKDSA